MGNQTSGAISARRKLLLGTMAVGGVAAAGVAWWQTRSPQGASTLSSNDKALREFWALQLPQPHDVQQIQPLVHWRGQPLLVNFWATWCPPCVQEMPLLSQFAREQKARVGIQVLGVAVDQPANVQKWLQHQPLDFPVLLAGAGGIGLTRGLGNIRAGLPFSILFNRQGEIAQRKIGALSSGELQRWLEHI